MHAILFGDGGDHVDAFRAFFSHGLYLTPDFGSRVLRMEGGEFPHQFAGTLVMGVRSLENYFN